MSGTTVNVSRLEGFEAPIYKITESREKREGTVTCSTKSSRSLGSPEVIPTSFQASITPTPSGTRDRDPNHLGPTYFRPVFLSSPDLRPRQSQQGHGCGTDRPFLSSCFPSTRRGSYPNLRPFSFLRLTVPLPFSVHLNPLNRWFSLVVKYTCNNRSQGYFSPKVDQIPFILDMSNY